MAARLLHLTCLCSLIVASAGLRSCDVSRSRTLAARRPNVRARAVGRVAVVAREHPTLAALEPMITAGVGSGGDASAAALESVVLASADLSVGGAFEAVIGFGGYLFALSWPAGLPLYALWKARKLPPPVLAWMDGWFGAGVERGVAATRRRAAKQGDGRRK